MKTPLEVNVEGTDLVLLTISGNVGTDQMPDFALALSEASKTIKGLFDNHGQKVKVLIDVSKFTGNYAVEAVVKLAGFAKNNTPYILKTASFGGSDKVKMAGEVIIQLAHRDNIKLFDTKKEAVEWLAI